MDLHIHTFLSNLPIYTRAVSPGLPQAAGVCMLSVAQERVDAVESVGPAQVPSAAG